MDLTDPTKTADAFLKIASVYKEENEDVKTAVLDCVGETSCVHPSSIRLFSCLSLIVSFQKCFTDEEEIAQRSVFIHAVQCLVVILC